MTRKCAGIGGPFHDCSMVDGFNTLRQWEPHIRSMTMITIVSTIHLMAYTRACIFVLEKCVLLAFIILLATLVCFSGFIGCLAVCVWPPTHPSLRPGEVTTGVCVSVNIMK